MSEEKDPTNPPEGEIPQDDTESHPRQKRSFSVQPVPISRPGFIPTGANSGIMIIHGNPGGGGNKFIPGAIAEKNKDKRTPLQKENSAAIHQAAKWSTEQLKKTQAEQAEKARAQAAAQARAKAERDALTAKLKKESDERLQKIREQDAKRAAERARAEEARKALFDKTGVKPAPVYTPQMVAEANAALKEPGVLALNQTPGSAQMALAGAGVWTAAGETSGSLVGAIGRGISALLGTATASTAGPMVAAASAIFFSAPAGAGSDKVPGRDVPALFALKAQHLAGQGVKIEPGATSVNLPVRGSLVNSNGKLALQLLKTGNGGIPSAVQVLTGVRDPKTGLDRITVPAIAGAGVPVRAILINPAQPPSAPSNTGTPPPPVPVTPVHTGTEVKPVDTITVTTTPVADHEGLQDFIYWRPDAAGTGVEPVYVVLSDSQGSPDSKGKTPELKIDGKIKTQMGERGWTEQSIRYIVAKGVTGKSFDKRSPKKTPPDYLGRNDSASVYGESGKYVVVNDRTGEITQISDKTDPKWIDDSRIQWGKNNGK